MSTQQEQLKVLMDSGRTDVVRKKVARLLVQLVSYNRMLTGMTAGMTAGGELRAWVERQLDLTILRSRRLLDTHKECMGV